MSELFPAPGTPISVQSIKDAFSKFCDEEGLVPGMEMQAGWGAITRAAIRVVGLRNRVISGPFE
jgi:hypothetical protein